MDSGRGTIASTKYSTSNTTYNSSRNQPQPFTHKPHQPNSSQILENIYSITTERSCGGQPPPTLLPIAPARPHRPHHSQDSVLSGQSESDFSLNATKKVLTFDCESQGSSLHEYRPYHQQNTQTQEFTSKVQNYLSQMCITDIGKSEQAQNTSPPPVYLHEGQPVQVRKTFLHSLTKYCFLHLDFTDKSWCAHPDRVYIYLYLTTPMLLCKYCLV